MYNNIEFHVKPQTHTHLFKPDEFNPELFASSVHEFSILFFDFSIINNELIEEDYIQFRFVK